MVKAESIMKKEVLQVHKNDKVSTAFQELLKDPESCVIIEDNGKVQGIITASDVVRFLADRKRRHTDKIATLMSSPVTSIHHSSSLEKASKVIDTKKHSNYPIRKDNMVIGVLSESQVVHSINDDIRFHRNIQNMVLVMFLVYAVAIIVVYGHWLPLGK